MILVIDNSIACNLYLARTPEKVAHGVEGHQGHDDEKDEDCEEGGHGTRVPALASMHFVRVFLSHLCF